MDILVTYLQDTVQVRNLLKTLPETGQFGKLDVQRTPVLFDTIRERRVVETVPPPPTNAQIRYWRWLREQKMLVGTSRYIHPKNKVTLVASENAAYEKGIGLPWHNIKRTNTDWLTLLLLLVLVLFATLRNTYSKYLIHLFQSLVNYSTAFRMFRERNYSILHGAFRLEIYFYFVFSVFIFQVLNYFQLHIAHNNFGFYAITFAAVLVYFVVKKVVYQIIGSVIKGTAETAEYLFNMDNFNRVLGLVLFPVVSLIAFFPAERLGFIVYLGLSVVSIFYLFLLQRGISILLRKQFSIFYLFLYLCSLEFLPLLLILKIVVE